MHEGLPTKPYGIINRGGDNTVGTSNNNVGTLTTVSSSPTPAANPVLVVTSNKQLRSEHE